jgi:hypothetical protein
VKKYLLVNEPTGMSAQQLGAAVGMRAIEGPLGTLMEQPKPFNLEAELERLERAMHPRQCNCAVVHLPPCPLAYAIS